MGSKGSEFRAGMRLGWPVVLASGPFGVLFGALAVENGFTVGEAVLMSATIYAGASQMVGIELFGQTIAPWLVVLSIFAVNFRHVLYSATVGRRVAHWPAWQKAIGFFFLVDAQYAEVELRAQSGKSVSFVWYMGMVSVVYTCWVTEALLGALFGPLIPDTHALGLDFLLPLYFLGLVMTFRGRSMWLPVVAASAVASIAAFHWIGSPWHVTVGAVAGVLLAAFAAPGRAGARR